MQRPVRIIEQRARHDDEIGLSRGHILSAAEASLRRLRVDYIDLYQIHATDPATPMEETLRDMARRTMDQLKELALGQRRIGRYRSGLDAAGQMLDSLG